MTPAEQAETVANAQIGDKQSLERLTLQARTRICAYLYRCTMDYDLAEELTQETMLQMVHSLQDLVNPEGFWPWLYQIARNKMNTHFRTQQRQKQHQDESFYRQYLSRLSERESRRGLENLLKTELARMIICAMKDLRPQEREVLSLRCLDQLSYAQIAQILGSSELNARIRFFRAKQILKKKLIRQGVGKGSLLMALGFFGRLTAADALAAETAVIPAVTAEVSFGTILAAAAGTKLAATVAGVVLLAASASTVRVLTTPPAITPKRQEVASVHYTIQVQNNVTGTPSSLSKGAYEHWFFFPEGVDGPVWMRMQRWDPAQTQKQCAWLQNGNANYYWHSGENKVYLMNYRLWRRSYTKILVRRLPSDPPQLYAFLDQVEGPDGGLTLVRDPRTDLVAEIQDARFVNAPDFRSTCQYNTLTDQTFGPFWPPDTTIIDERDPMRRRGWTYFHIRGELNHEPISGRGCIPFFTEHVAEHPAWLKLDIGSRMQYVDTPQGAVFYAGGKSYGPYPPGSFFAGLPRPWMGLHVIDIIRRDAARQEIAFETFQENDYYADAMVRMHRIRKNSTADLDYLVDMDGDLIVRIDLRADGLQAGSGPGWMEFDYIQSMGEIREEEFAMPDLLNLPTRFRDGPGIHWLFDLAENR